MFIKEIDFVKDEDGKIIEKDGRPQYICKKCKKISIDVVEIYHGKCHK